MVDSDKLFAARINDLFNICENRGIVKFSPFLDQAQQHFAAREAEKHHMEFMFFGGYEGSERNMLGVFPEYMAPSEESFPITAVSCRYKKEYQLSHRDFLGALMSLKITRESVGDIVVSEGCAVIYLSNNAAKSVLTELSKVGRVGVEVSTGAAFLPENVKRFETIEGTVASLRLDAVISFLLKISREKACTLIDSGFVTVNYSQVKGVSQKLCDGDIISARGYGKFVFCGTGGVSKKGRIFITCKKYV